MYVCTVRAAQYLLEYLRAVGCGLWDVWWSIIMGYMDFGFWSGDAPHNLERTKRENLKTPHQDGS